MKRLKVPVSVLLAAGLTLAVGPAASAAPSLSETLGMVPSGGGTMTAILFFAVLVLVFVSMAFVVRQGKSGYANVPWAILAIVLSGLALTTCVVGYSFGTLYTKPDGDPRETVEKFYSSLERGDYPTAYSCLSDYTGLGLENEPADENGKLVYQKLRESYSHTVMGKATINKLSAFVPVRFRYLRIKDTERSIQSEVNSLLERFVKENPRNLVYGADNHYLPEVTEKVYSDAVARTMRNISEFCTTEQFNVELEYKDGQWYIVTSPEMLNAIIGGTAQ